MNRNFFLSALIAAIIGVAAMSSVARADVATDIAAVLANASLTAEEIAVQVAEMVTNAEDPSAAAAIILGALAGASDAQLEGVGVGLGNAVLALQQTDAAEASEVALEVTTAPEAVQTSFATTTGSTAAVLAGGTGDSLLGTESGSKSAD
ncbi:MAG: hypothetical protein JKY51_08015 [Opitutaceae bacterium]|nr:hypothetical protein [Opitutaceae bacterium]